MPPDGFLTANFLGGQSYEAREEAAYASAGERTGVLGCGGLFGPPPLPELFEECPDSGPEEDKSSGCKAINFAANSPSTPRSDPVRM